MTAQEQSALHDILEECYDVQLELSDILARIAVRGAHEDAHALID